MELEVQSDGMTRGKGRYAFWTVVNIVRLPMGGRNFESGEDPFLTSRMTVSYIKVCRKKMYCNS